MGNGPFKMRSGNSPLKETKDWFNVRGYLKGEQGLIPDWKGESTAKTATKVSKAIQKGHGKVKKVVKKVLNPKKNEPKNGGGKFLATETKLTKSRPKEKLIKIDPIQPRKLKVDIPSEPRKRPRQS